MSRRNLHELPRFKDGWSFLYVDKAIVDREQNGLRIVQGKSRTLVPIATLSALLLGPGVSITHAAVTVAGDAGCSIAWCGEQGVRFYASGGGDDRRCRNLLFQARRWANEEARLDVVKRMYRMRFGGRLRDGLTLAQIRGMEGVRVRQTYARLSQETGIRWKGRAYRLGNWSTADPVNRALSAANSCLHALCHSAIAIAGYSDAIGFVHTGKSRAFVYDIADLYKADLTIPLAFRAAKGGDAQLETRVRRTCRAAFYESRLLERIIPDIQRALGQSPEPARQYEAGELDPDILELWDPGTGTLRGGQNFSDAPLEAEAEPGEPDPDAEDGS